MGPVISLIVLAAIVAAAVYFGGRCVRKKEDKRTAKLIEDSYQYTPQGKKEAAERKKREAIAYCEKKRA